MAPSLLSANTLHIALVGNPNSGKSSLFNELTGLNQKVGNFPGVTVDKKTGRFTLNAAWLVEITDLPGTYSLYPKREDEWVSYRVLMGQDAAIKPNLVILVADASNLKRNLLFCSQIIDLNVPVIVALTMTDIARKRGTDIDLEGLQTELGVPVVAVNPRKGKGIQQLLKTIELFAQPTILWQSRPFIDIKELAGAPIAKVHQQIPNLSDYAAVHYLINHERLSLDKQQQLALEQIEIEEGFNHTKTQANEIMLRYQRIRQIMQKTVVEADPLARKMFTDRLDNLLLHRFWGYFILLLVLFFLFQSIFWFAQLPMSFIENGFGWLAGKLGATLPSSWWSSLLIDGVVAGLGGILVFVPQIMILFGLITLLEDTGYMARISFLTDKLMRKVGLNGKSLMPLISGFACAVPAIMSARNIENQKERLITILITPFMSCSARLPVFAILISLIVPNTYFLGFLSLQGLVMMGLYILGITVALVFAFFANFFISLKDKSYFILELPVYRSPRWKNVATTMIEKARVFVFDAGKIIMIVSIFLWVLSSFGPPIKMQTLQHKYELLRQQPNANWSQLEKDYGAEHLENSYAGILGKWIEPAIKPLGYDWKIGIALITSFAAREVFVGTMATLYSVGEADASSNQTLTQKMRNAKKQDGSPMYTVATGVSLLIFYLLAMQCMSTLAIVKRETKSWKWPILQFILMTGIAWLFSFLAYQSLR